VGLVANAAEVRGGSEHYGGYDEPLQKVGLLYRERTVARLDARVILGAEAQVFAGRPPLAVKLRVTLSTGARDVVVVALHAKCCSNAASWERRQSASRALKAYLDEAHPSDAVWVLGDFNDDLDESISAGQSSPYANFVVDTGDYSFPTWALTEAGTSTTTDYPDVIDHHLVTDEANATYLPGSAQVLRVDRSIPDYAETTSDHFPVLSRYAW
jgi:endonuclease/exonuclease/phosphatase family metal-dependent hydrolase